MHRYIILFCLIALALMGCDQPVVETSPHETRVPQVKTMLIQPHKWSESFTSYGVIEAAKEVKITVEFSAKADKIYFKEGDTVKRGQELILFDSSKRKLRLDNAKQAVRDALARLDNARQIARRNRELFRAGNISHSEYDNSESELRRATAQYEQSITSERLAIRELRDSKLVSPVTGVVEKCSIDSGEAILPGQVLGIIQVVETVRVVTYINEKYINHLRIGSEAKVISAGAAGQIYTATIESLGIKADPRTGNFEVKLTIQNDGGLLRPGMTTRVTLEGLEIEDAILVPENSVVDRRRRKVIYKLVDGKAVEVEPLLGASPADEFLVLQGLAAGDKLIISELHQIVDGTTVEERP